MTNLAQTPVKSTPEAAGFDLFDTKEVTILPGHRLPIPTGIKMQLPKGTYERIAPRSGLALKQSIDVAAGVIDADYRGEILPILVNNSNSTITLRSHSKVAQLIIVHINTMDLMEVVEINKTLQSSDGYGSTDTQIPSKTTATHKEDSTTTPFKWMKPNAPDSKITIKKLPWNSYFSKGHITKNNQSFQFVDLEHPDILHILPTHQVKTMIHSKPILLGHKQTKSRIKNNQASMRCSQRCS